jgi:hypothetical protein
MPPMAVYSPLIDGTLLVVLFLFALLLCAVLLMALAWLMLLALQSWPAYRADFRHALTALRSGGTKGSQGDFVPLQERPADRIRQP